MFHEYDFYYINLDSEIERNNHFLNQISNTIFFDRCIRHIGVNGQLLDINAVHDDIITDSARRDIVSQRQNIFGISLTYGSLACALSHRFLWTKCASQTKPFLIFEDDMILDQAFERSLLNITKIQSTLNYDIIYLGYNEIPGFHKQEINSVISKPSGLITGLHGYIVSPSGCQKLLEYIFPMNIQIDSSISNNIKNLNLYCSSKNIVFQNTKFRSRTQRSNGCVNLINKTTDNWHKLFL